MSDVLKTFKKHLLLVAKKHAIKPCNVTSSQFWFESTLKEWDVRKLGGFTNLRDSLFPSPLATRLLPRASKKIKVVTPKLINFEVHEADVRELFKQAKLGKNDVFKIVVQPDTHCEEINIPAMNAVCKFLEYYKPHGLINLGDFLEWDAVSAWKNLSEKAKRLTPQILAGRELLDRLGKAAGPQCFFKRFCVGNHEFWLRQYLLDRIPEVIEGLETLGPDLSVEGLLKLKDFGYRTIPLNEILKVGHAHFIHGYYTGQNHAKKHLDVFGVNLYYGHLHDTQSYSGVSVNGVHEAASLGCLRSLNAPFLKGRPNNWVASISWFEFRYDGSYTRYTPSIIDGVFSLNGIVFNGNEK